jgi:hypothetical protein
MGRITPKAKSEHLEALVNILHKAVEMMEWSEEEVVRGKKEILADVYHLSRLAAADKITRIALDHRIRAAGIKANKNTRNEYTLLVNYIFGKKIPAASRTRFADTILLAAQENVKVGDFAAFLEEQGGIVACSKRITDQRKKAAGLPTAEAKARDIIKARMADAPKFKVPQKLGLPEGHVVCVALKVGPDGNCYFLGSHDASLGEILALDKAQAAVSAKRKAR